MGADFTDRELRARLNQLGARVAELKAARQPPPEKAHIERGPVSPTAALEAELLERSGGWGFFSRNPVFPVVSFILFVRSLSGKR